MFSSIRTSRANKEIVTKLTNKMNLGAENIIARLALSYSLAQERHLDLQQISDANGKEYSLKVLFGDYADFYIGLVSVHYQLYHTDKDIGRYIKMHIDDGLDLIHRELESKPGMSGTDFIINEIERGLAVL